MLMSITSNLKSQITEFTSFFIADCHCHCFTDSTRRPVGGGAREVHVDVANDAGRTRGTNTGDDFPLNRYALHSLRMYLFTLSMMHVGSNGAFDSIVIVMCDFHWLSLFPLVVCVRRSLIWLFCRCFQHLFIATTFVCYVVGSFVGSVVICRVTVVMWFWLWVGFGVAHVVSGTARKGNFDPFVSVSISLLQCTLSC